MPQEPAPSRCSLPRRLAAMFYDALLLFAVLFFAAALALPFTGGEAVQPDNPLFTAYLLVIAFLFFGGFWTHGGQTLGMRVWGIRLQSIGGGPVTWRQALVRFLAAFLSWGALGLGFLWSLVDRDGLAWHDRLSGNELVVTRQKIPHR